MTALVALLFIVSVTLFAARLGAISLALTGISKDMAELQSISAITGVGFTTSESEHIVGHAVRRRILIGLMVVGNAGIVTAVTSLVLSFVNVGSSKDVFVRLAVLLVGIVVLFLLSRSQALERVLQATVDWGLRRWSRFQVVDYAGLMRLEGDFTVAEFPVEPGSWLDERDLEHCRLLQEGVTVLGIRRANGEYVGIPRGETMLHAGDDLVLYAHAEDLERLRHRPRGREGDTEHDCAVDDTVRERAERFARETEPAATVEPAD